MKLCCLGFGSLFAILHCHLYLTDELREDSSALPTIIIVIIPLTALMKDQVFKKCLIFVQIVLHPRLTID